MTTTPERTATLTTLVAAEIRAWLGRLDLRPAELARRLGENDQWMSSRLKGRTPINVNDLQRVADALGLSVVDLLPQRASRPSGKGSAGVDLNDSSGEIIRSAPVHRSIGRPNGRAAGRAGNPALSKGRRDAARPVSAVPANLRRPSLTRPGVRTITR
jgi:transcriptional regulator with XRE-family HTH domain